MKAPIFKSALLIAVTSLLFSCQKDVSELSAGNSTDSKTSVSKNKRQEHKLKGEYYAYWDTTMTAEGAYAYGNGDGHLNILGKSRVFYNTFSYYMTFWDVYNAPVTLFQGNLLNQYGYQNLDEEVSAIFFDQHGNSIFFGIQDDDPGFYDYHEMPPAPVVSPVGIEINYKILGGTGKFEGATGSTTLTGYWNPLPPFDTGLKVEGTIEF